RSTLRLRPDRIIVGEVRGPEALVMLKAWNTGHPGGLTTVHANCAASALLRLEQLIQEAVVTVPRDLIVQAIDVVVFLVGRGNNRRVETVAEVSGLDDAGNYVLKPLGFLRCGRSDRQGNSDERSADATRGWSPRERGFRPTQLGERPLESRPFEVPERRGVG